MSVVRTSHASDGGSSNSYNKKKVCWQTLIMEAAKKISADRLNDGFIAALSPTPQIFIDAILQDDIFDQRGTENRMGTNKILPFATYDSIVINSDEGSGEKNYSSSSKRSCINSARDRSSDNEDGRNSSVQGNRSQRFLVDEMKSTNATHSVHSVVDLGCGDGRWLIAFHKRFNCCCFGIEKDLNRLDVCRERVRVEFQNISLNPTENQLKTGGTHKIELLRCDFSNFSCSGISVVIIFLSREGNEMIKEKLEKECSMGTIVLVIGVRIKLYFPLQLKIFLIFQDGEN